MIGSLHQEESSRSLPSLCHVPFTLVFSDGEFTQTFFILKFPEKNDTDSEMIAWFSPCHMGPQTLPLMDKTWTENSQSPAHVSTLVIRPYPKTMDRSRPSSRAEHPAPNSSLTCGGPKIT